jgi:HD superfamily phosphohydrolase
MKPRIFRDPIHGLISLEGEDALLAQVLDTPAVQRLRRIRQMGFAQLVYPGAEHSRFGHALGAFHVAARVTSHLRLPAAVARDVRVAALLHDIGHGPFSHAWEAALGGADHEAWGRRIVAEDAPLRAALGDVAPELPAAMDSLLADTYRPRVAKKLVGSQLDVDRMDYLLRDAYYAGVSYSAYDLDWVIHALGLSPVRAGDDPLDLVIDYGRGVHAVEQYLLGRFSMYAQVYYHKTVRAAEWMFLLLMHRFATLARAHAEPPELACAAKLARGEPVTVEDYLTLDDARVHTALEDWARGAKDPVLRDLAARLVCRRLFKTLEVGGDPDRVTSLLPRLEEAARAVFSERASSYFAVDRAERLGYDARPGEEIFVVGHPRLGTVDLGQLGEELPIQRQRFTVRVVVAPELQDAFVPIVNGRS